MGTQTPDPNRPQPQSPDGEFERRDAQRDPRNPQDRPEDKRRRPPEVNPDDPRDDDDLNQPGQSGVEDRERSGSTRSRTP
jgi:hypothetical protein